MNELFEELACFGCPYKDECEDDWESGHSQCDEMLRSAQEFVKRTGIGNQN